MIYYTILYYILSRLRQPRVHTNCIYRDWWWYRAAPQKATESQKTTIVAIFYPFSQFCEIDISLRSLQKHTKQPPTYFRGGQKMASMTTGGPAGLLRHLEGPDRATGRAFGAPQLRQSLGLLRLLVEKTTKKTTIRRQHTNLSFAWDRIGST